MAIIMLKDLHKMQRWEGYQVNKTWNYLDNVGRFIDMKVRLGDKNGSYEGVINKWKGQPCFVVGGSRSARGFDLNLLDNKNTIGMNHMIEIYDKFKWFVFMDQRFLRICKYNLKNYKGAIFAHNNSRVMHKDFNNLYLFKTISVNMTPSIDIARGLYARSLTGLVAVHLAIISGADPIYLIGMDEPREYNTNEGIHYHQNYTGEAKDRQKSKDGYDSLRKYFQQFTKFNAKIINCCIDGQMNFFKRIDIKTLENTLKGGRK